MIWLGERRGHLVDWLTQRWVQATGDRLAQADAPWLWGPVGSTSGIGPGFFEELAAARGLVVLPASPEAGLLPGLEALAGPRFRPQDVAPAIASFYAHTAGFDLRIESRWSGPFRAMAKESGRPVFVGQYGTATIPGHEGRCVKVVFPLPNGNATILLRPEVDEGGGLSLISDGRRFGDVGFYFTVVAGPQHDPHAQPRELWVRYVRTMKESLALRAADDGVTAVHRFRVFGLPFLELRYAIARKPRTAVLGAQADLPPRL